MTWSLRTNDFKREPLNTVVTTPPKKDVIVISLKKLGFHWGIAVFCVFVPVLHFILVPLFLLIGVLSFTKQYKYKYQLTEARPLCPHCRNSFIIKNIYFSDGQKINCDLCQTQLVIEKQI